MTNGEKIKQQRKIMNMSQEKLSSLLGVSLKTVQRWESDSRSPNSLIMPQLATALNTTVNYLMGVEDSSQGQTTFITTREKVKPEQPRVSNPSMSYWGGVLDNAKLAVQNGQNLGLIYSLLTDAAGTVKAAMA